MKFTAYLALPVMLFTLILQVAILPRFPVLGLVPLLSLLAAVSWGLLRGPEEGILWAFVGGFLLDLFTSGPTGAITLAMMLAVLVVVLIQHNFPNSSFFLPILYAGLATIVYLAGYLLLITLFDRGDFTAESVRLLLPLIFLNALIMLPIHWLLSRLERVFSPRRVELQ
jgi:rod shape-determining protein MreD